MSSHRYMTNAEKSLIASSLRIARDFYRRDAATLAKNNGHEHLMKQFLQQADDAERLADEFDTYPDVEIDRAA